MRAQMNSTQAISEKASGSTYVELNIRNLWTLETILSEGVSNLERFTLLREALQEVIINLCMHIDS